MASRRNDKSVELGDTPPPARSTKPAKPKLLPPRDVPRGCITAGASERLALLHALPILNSMPLIWHLTWRAGLSRRISPEIFTTTGLELPMMNPDIS